MGWNLWLWRRVNWCVFSRCRHVVGEPTFLPRRQRGLRAGLDGIPGGRASRGGKYHPHPPCTLSHSPYSLNLTLPAPLPRWGCREVEGAGKVRVQGAWGCREHEGAGRERVLGGWGWELPPWHAPPPGIPSSPRWGCREVEGAGKVRVQGAWGCREGEGENYLYGTLHLLVNHPALGEDAGKVRRMQEGWGWGCWEGEGENYLHSAFHLLVSHPALGEDEGAGRVRVRITSMARSTSWYPIQPWKGYQEV